MYMYNVHVYTSNITYMYSTLYMCIIIENYSQSSLIGVAITLHQLYTLVVFCPFYSCIYIMYTDVMYIQMSCIYRCHVHTDVMYILHSC